MRKARLCAEMSDILPAKGEIDGARSEVGEVGGEQKVQQERFPAFTGMIGQGDGRIGQGDGRIGQGDGRIGQNIGGVGSEQGVGQIHASTEGKR